MGRILNIDTSTNVGSVAFSIDGKVIFERLSHEDRTHAVKIGIFVDEVMTEVEAAGHVLDAVAVCSGPGSYTGLRIGVSIAKGLCYGYDIPLIAIDSLKVMAKAVRSDDVNALLCPMIDARRMEVYAALFTTQLDLVQEISAKIIEEDAYQDVLSNKKVIFFGNGAAKCREHISSENALFLEDVVPLASNLAPLAEIAFEQKSFVDVAYFEPFYLKDFVATVSKKSYF